MFTKFLVRLLLLLAFTGAGLAGGYWLARQGLALPTWLSQIFGEAASPPAMHETKSAAPPPAADPLAGVNDAPAERKVLYWYDPMFPQQKFDQPGASPFMDMQLVPKYADGSDNATAIRIDPSVTQNLGVRLALVSRGPLLAAIDAIGVIAFNERDVSIVQARANGFVERVYQRAPGDVITAGAPLADVLVPEWAAAQEEFLALKAHGDAGLLDAARNRMRLAGMPPELITRVAASGKPHTISTITAPAAGVIQELMVRSGMTVMAGQTLAQINGLRSVWLDIAVPETQAGLVRVGQAAEVRLTAQPGESIHGQVMTILTQASLDSRTVRVRVELPNPGGNLRPGQTAQVRLTAADSEPVLLVTSEAVIRTGQQALVMVAEAGGRFRPQKIEIGRETGGHTVVLKGLREGEQVIASGQFLIDSEASLRGILGRAAGADTGRKAVSAVHETEAKVVAIKEGAITLDHQPFKTIPGMPGMTMSFPLATPGLTNDIKVGDAVRVGVSERDNGLVVERIEKISTMTGAAAAADKATP